ncbi:translocation/assembly module TamB domain-containing protein [Pacificibacter sp.]|uniref:translocation/assembly module TamB domain-containing protein n=1 Tax=Pacificibacter sp. TaxID=1917866 RepID=UPI00321BCC52
MRKRFGIIVAACLPVVAWAQTQDTQAESARDRSLIVAFLEDNLSSTGRDIRIEGFKGLLSSKATLDSLTISDDAGVWFSLKDAELDWKRTALFSGQLEINSLSAASIEVLRRPTLGQSNVTPEATVFALPDLPVGIEIGDISARSVTLGRDFLGVDEDVELTFEGRADLAEGSGSATLDIQRLTGPSGSFQFFSSYSNASTQLALDLSLTEGKGGFISTLVGLPGSPDLSLTAKGEGPLDTFRADIALTTEGQPRLTGQLGLSLVEEPSQAESNAPDSASAPSEQPKARAFFADLNGDVTPLFDPSYAKFFGPSSALRAEGVSHPDGRLSLDAFSLKTDAMSLRGSVAIDANALPTAFDVSGLISNASGTPLLLPLAGEKRFITRAAVTAKYNANTGETWTAAINVDDYRQNDIALDSVALTGTGTISRRRDASGLAMLRSVNAGVSIAANGIQLADSALNTAIGSDVTAQTQVLWRDGAPLTIRGFELDTEGTQVTATGTVSGLNSGFAFKGKASVKTPQLSRFAPLTGLAMNGAMQGTATGTFTPLGGSFDAELRGTTQSASIGIPKVDALLAGQSQFDISAVRDETGLTLNQFDLRTSAIQAQGSGRLTSAASNLTFTASLDDIGRLDAGIQGPLSTEAQVKRTTADEPWQASATMTGPGGSNAQVSGSIANTFKRANLSLSGSAPLGLVNALTTSALLQGTADFDLQLDGPLALSSLKGTLSTRENARAVVSATGLSLKLDQFRVNLADANAAIEANATADTGGRFTATGRVGLTQGFQSNIDIALENVVFTGPDLFTTTVGGSLGITGPLLGTPRVSGALLLGRTDIRVAPAALGAGGGILDVTHQSEPSLVRQTRARAGLLAEAGKQTSQRDIALDVSVSAPNQVFIRGRGLDAELGGTVRLTGTTQDIVPVGQFSLIRGRLSILGKRIELQQGRLVLQGDFDPNFSLVAVTSTDDLDISMTTSGRISAPKFALSSSPDLPQEEILAQFLFGRALSDISAFQAAQLVAAIATLTGNGDGVVGSIRDGIGVDDLDLTTSEQGEAALRIGKYLSDKVYTDVTIDSAGKSIINLNLDASDTVTFKGSMSPDGDTSLGVFFEKDY